MLQYASRRHGRDCRKALRPPGFTKHCIPRSRRAGEDASGCDDESDSRRLCVPRAAKHEHEEQQFVGEMGSLFPDLRILPTATDLQRAAEGADILVTATSAQAPLLKAAWMKPGAFYGHVGGWEDEDEVARPCQKMVCDDWETVKHRTRTLSRMYKDGALADDEMHANLVEVVAGIKSGRETAEERIYFNAVGPAYIDVAIAHAMYERAREAGAETRQAIQDNLIFQHEELANWIRM